MDITNESLSLIEAAIRQGISNEKFILEYAERIAEFEGHERIDVSDVAEAIQYRFEEVAKDGMYYVNSVFINVLFTKNRELESIKRRIDLGITKKVNVKVVKIFSDIKNVIFSYFKPDTIELLREWVEIKYGNLLTIRDLNRIYKIVSNVEISGKKANKEDLAFAIQKYG